MGPILAPFTTVPMFYDSGSLKNVGTMCDELKCFANEMWNDDGM